MSDARKDFEALSHELVAENVRREEEGLPRMVTMIVDEEALINMHRLAEIIKARHWEGDSARTLADLVLEGLFDPREETG